MHFVRDFDSNYFVNDFFGYWNLVDSWWTVKSKFIMFILLNNECTASFIVEEARKKVSQLSLKNDWTIIVKNNGFGLFMGNKFQILVWIRGWLTEKNFWSENSILKNVLPSKDDAEMTDMQMSNSQNKRRICGFFLLRFVSSKWHLAAFIFGVQRRTRLNRSFERLNFLRIKNDMHLWIDFMIH